MSASAAATSRPRIAVLDFGSQYSQLIARRLRELGVFSELLPCARWREALAQTEVRGVVLSGGPASVTDPGAPDVGPELLAAGVPVLGICYGMQLMCDRLGGRVEREARREYGAATITLTGQGPLFAGTPGRQQVWMSHGDRVTALPPGFTALASSETIPFAAAADPARRLACVQFHPEVAHTEHGLRILENFARGICGIEERWSAAGFVAEALAEIRAAAANDSVLCAVSGGVDSTVVATLVDRAIGERLHCVFVDNGLLRLGEADAVPRTLDAQLRRPVRRVDAGPLFLERLRGVTDPERKRRIIGATFIEAFREAARAEGAFRFLAQGTLYPDRIESQAVAGPASTIKTHHNVGGLPEDLGFELLEPLRDLFKDEVRAVGRELGIPAALLMRHPFPGPGLAVRILGEVTPEKVRLLQAADHIFIEELRAAGEYDRIWQAGAILLPVQSVGVMGDQRTYECAIALRAVTSLDGMTADWARVPPEVLARVSNRIINEVHGVNRVVYDVSSKPPATIVWD